MGGVATVDVKAGVACGGIVGDGVMRGSGCLVMAAVLVDLRGGFTS